jgi:hypothetical protein
MDVEDSGMSSKRLEIWKKGARTVSASLSKGSGTFSMSLFVELPVYSPLRKWILGK